MTRPRRALRLFLFLSALLFAVTVAAAGRSGPNPFQAAKESAATTTVATTGTGVANNDFLPDKNLSDCVNTNEQPNCGSAAKGTKGMYFTFAALVLGLGFVMWRISLSVRARDAVVNAEPDADAEPVTDEPSAP